MKLAVKAPEKPQLHQHMRPGTDNGGLNEVQDWFAGAAAKAAKVAVKSQGNSAEIAVNAQDWLQGAKGFGILCICFACFGISWLINGIIRLIHGINQLINGISRQLIVFSID